MSNDSISIDLHSNRKHQFHKILLLLKEETDKPLRDTENSVPLGPVAKQPSI